jgi:hypothetical protein
MDVTETKAQLTAILQNLPTDYSQNGARKLMSAFENYKHIARALLNNSANIRAGVHSEFDDIELAIRLAIKGTPKKEAESCFAEARNHMMGGMAHIIAALGDDFGKAS